MGRAADPRELRRFILVQPVLDFGALQPGARAVAAIRQAVVETGFAADPRVRVRLTGPVPLADEEFATLAEGAALNARGHAARSSWRCSGSRCTRCA